MLKRLFLYFIGCVVVFVDDESIAGATKTAFSLGLPVILGRRKKRGRRLILRYADYDAFADACRENGVAFTLVKRSGLPELRRRYGRRLGLFIGGAIFIAAIFIADDFVWRIDVSGNEAVSDETIINELDALGFRLGTRHKNVDYDVLHNRFLLASPDISWIAVNMKGSVARVEVREYIKGGGERDDSPANIVADEGGVITQVSDFAGSAQVKIGDEVVKGQLLISGIVDYEDAPTEIVRARGEVYAEVWREIAVRVPLVSVEKMKTDDNFSDFAIKIFSKTIFFGSKGRIDTDFYDTITVKHEIVLPGTVILPITVIENRHERYEDVTVTRTPDEAAVEAYRQFKLAFIEACRDVTLLEYDMTDGMNETGDAYEIVCRVRVIKNIAKTAPFDAG